MSRQEKPQRLARIHWKSSYTNVTGHGEPIPELQARNSITELDNAWPGITHWVELEPEEDNCDSRDSYEPGT